MKLEEFCKGKTVSKVSLNDRSFGVVFEDGSTLDLCARVVGCWGSEDAVLEFDAYGPNGEFMECME